MKNWLWLVLFIGAVAAGVYYTMGKKGTPEGAAAEKEQAAPPELTAPTMESSSGPLGGEIAPRQDSAIPQPPNQPQTYNNQPNYQPPPPPEDPGMYTPPPTDIPTYNPPPDQSFENIEPPPPPPPAYVDPIPGPDDDYNGGNIPPPPPPVDEEF